jgi:tripeptidyl-peptidase-1
MFFTSYAPNIPNGTHPIPAFIDGATAPVPQSDAGNESDLDLAIALSLIYPQSVTLYQTDDSAYGKEFRFIGFNGLFNTFLDALDGVSTITETVKYFVD